MGNLSPMIKQQCKSALGMITLKMYVGNKVVLYLMFLKLMVGIGPTFRCFTLVMPVASEKNMYQLLLLLFFKQTSNENHVGWKELILAVSTYMCNVYFLNSFDFFFKILNHFFFPQVQIF